MSAGIPDPGLFLASGLIADVEIDESTLADRQALIWDSASQLWKNQTQFTIQDVGDTNATITSGVRFVRLTTALTAARVLTLPLASAYSINTWIDIINPRGVASASNTVSVARAGSDTIDGGTSNVVVINAAYGYTRLWSDGVSKWSTANHIDGSNIDTGITGTGNVVKATSPTIVTPAAFTTGGTITLAENHSIALDPAGSADGKFTGITLAATAGYTQAFGDLVYLDPTDSRWEQCDANSAAGADGDARGILGMVVVAGTDGNACTILLQGIIRADAKFPTFTVNNPIYVSETAGAVTQTQPTTTDVVIRVVGSALTADEMYFNPDRIWITHT